MTSDIHPIPAEPVRMKITPEIARDWLENRNAERQRRYSKYMAQKWADVMLSGRWKCTHQGLAFDWDGFLIDGQHRLGAVILTGLTVEMWVHPNCDPDTFDVLDQGYKRQASHLIRTPNAKAVAAAARILAVVTKAVPLSQNVEGGVYDGSLPTDVVLEVVELWPELGDYATPVANAYRYSKISMPMHLAIVVQASRTRYGDRLASWFDGLTNGVGLEGSDSRLHLRNRFVRDGRLLAHQRNQCYNLIAKAWNAHAQQRPMGVLKTTEGEGVVRVVG
jgi:hypothetical protein